MRMLAKNSADALRLALSRVTQRAQQGRPRPGLGEYGINEYDETDAFRANANPGQLQTDVNGALIPDPYYNGVGFNTYTFATSNVSGNAGSVQLLALNQRRQLLLIQNLSTASDLYVSFGLDASLLGGLLLAHGEGVIFDTVCPNNSVFVFFNSATNQPGIIIEGSPVG